MMTEDEINEGWSVIGEKIRTTVDEIRKDATLKLNMAGAIEDAWSENDWTWLVEQSVLGAADVGLIRKLNLAAEEMTTATIKPIAGEGEVVLTVKAQLTDLPDKEWAFYHAVPETLSPKLCIAIANGILFTSDLGDSMDLQVQVKRDDEIIQEWQ